MKRSVMVCPECGALVGLRRIRAGLRRRPGCGKVVYRDHWPEKKGAMVDHRGMCFSSGHFPKQEAA